MIPNNPHGQDHSSDEREWQAQERAMRDERRDAAPASKNTSEATYRLIAQALSQPPTALLPIDFAEQVARLATKPTRAARTNRYPERYLLYALGAVLVLSCASTLLMYGDSLRRLVESRVGGWLFVLLICAISTQSIEGLYQRFHRNAF